MGEYQLGYSPVFSWGHVKLRDAFRPIAREQKYLMDYKAKYLTMIG